MTTVDITADLNEEDETGLVWTFLDEARDRSVITPGAFVAVGTPASPAIAEVVNLIDKLAGAVVHLRVLPGDASNHADTRDRWRMNRSKVIAPDHQRRRTSSARSPIFVTSRCVSGMP